MKRKIHLLLLSLMSSIPLMAQNINNSNIKTYQIPLHSTVHIVSPEKIDYVDISSPKVMGDLPTDYIFRLKCDDTKMKAKESFQVTVASNSYVQTLKLVPTEVADMPQETYLIRINTQDATPINALNNVNQEDFNQLAMNAMSKKRKVFNVSAKEQGIEYWVNNIFTYGDYILLDITAHNNTRINYQIDNVKFMVVDKPSTNETTEQEFEIKPLFALYPSPAASVQKNGWRNLYLFNRFTYTNDKVLKIELSEKEYSGRKVVLNVDYNQILKSDYLN